MSKFNYKVEVKGKGGIVARIVADSVSHEGKRIVTFEGEVHRSIWSEFMTHRLFSRNAMSCLTGDTEVYTLKPSSITEETPHGTIQQKWKIQDLVDKWFDGDSKGRDMKTRLKDVYIRCLNEDTGEYQNTKLVDCFRQGTQPVYEIKLKDGKNLKCTENHRLYSRDKGWITLKDLDLKKMSSGEIAFSPTELVTNGYEVDLDFVEKELDKGKSLKFLAEELDIPYKSLSHITLKNKIYTKSFKDYKERQKFTKDFYKDKEWLQSKVKEGWFFTNIADICHCSVDKVKRQAKKFGIEGNKWSWGSKKVWNKGLTYSQTGQALQNIRDAAKRRVKIGSYKNYKDGSKEKRTRFNQELRNELINSGEFVCAVTGVTSKLELHHVDPVWNNPDKTFDKENIIPIHKDLHKRIHSNNLDILFKDWYESGKNVKEFFDTYEDLKLLCEDIKKTVGRGNKLIARSSEIESIAFIGEEETYDIEVEDPYHNFVANGIVVHNSRAVPILKMIENTKAVPIKFGAKKAGMVAGDEHDEPVVLNEILFNEETCEYEWHDVAYSKEAAWEKVAEKVKDFAHAFDAAGYHKGDINRLLEPFQHIKFVMTATELDNFMFLRRAPDAKEEIRELADCMYVAMQESEPQLLKAGEWHVPYVDTYNHPEGLRYLSGDKEISLEEALAISSSCCGQVSYRRIDNSYEKAMSVYEKLGVGSEGLHASPFEHQGTPMKMDITPCCVHSDNSEDDKIYVTSPCDWEEGVTHMDRNSMYWSGNFRGWIQHRQLLDNHTCWSYDG